MLCMFYSILTVPEFSHPFRRAAGDSDLILVSEFSEVHGPVPILAYPHDGGQNFEKNR